MSRARPRVLVIEDDPDFREVVCRILEDEGFEAVPAPNGHAGLALALAEPPALVLCDLHMPLMDGRDTLLQLRGNASTASVPVILVTAASMQGDLRQLASLGANDFLVKPVSTNDLLAVVHANLRPPARSRPPAHTLPPTRPGPIKDEPTARSRSEHPAIIAGRYHLIRRAGRGGMGSIYLARDLVRAEDVAVKFIAGHVSTARFDRECAILAGLRNDRVVRYREHGVTESEQHFLVMDWLSGHDLAARLASERLSLADGLRVLRSGAEALAAIHPAGIVHRDVKPSNLFLVDGAIERLTLIDFGVAQAPDARQITFTGEFVGTPAFVAPEQVRHEGAADARSDVFSLACTVWACLTGASPFSGADAVGSLARLLTEDAPSVLSLCPEVPASIEALLASMLSRDPSLRPADGRAVLDLLDKATLAPAPTAHACP